MNAAIYARKSTEQNGAVDEAKSVTRQVESARAYAAAKGWTVDEHLVFVDDGVSGAEFERRPGFQRLMSALAPRPAFQVLVMSEESRLGREAIETSYALKQIITAGVRVFVYLENRELTLGSMADNTMAFLRAEFAAEERRKASQRTYDAMLRKARAGHVTGGWVFGYENVRVNGHVERRIIEAEAAVVRRIFELYADGVGLTTIAKRLNAEHAPAPRPQRGRPVAWAPSSVREVLHRRLYAGEIVWNQTAKRDVWGQRRHRDKQEEEWLRLPAPHLRIIHDDLWHAAHRELTAARARYLRGTGGQLWGRARDAESKYLLPGFARCALCGGGLCVRSRSHGRHRGHFTYACTSCHKRGACVCPNGLELRMLDVDRAVLASLAGDVLHPDIVQAVVAEALEALGPRADEAARVERRLRELDSEIAKLVAAVAAGKALEPLVEALRLRQHEREDLRAALDRLQRITQHVDRVSLEEDIRARLVEWRELLTDQVTFARQMFRKILLDGPIVFTPDLQARTVRFEGRASLVKLLGGLIDPTSVASPTGLVTSRNPVLSVVLDFDGSVLLAA